METEKNPNMIRNIAIGVGVAIVVIGFIVFAVAKSKSNIVDTTKSSTTSASAQAPTPVDCKYTWNDWKCDNTAKKATRTPKVTTEASGGGLACPAPEIQNCNDCEVTWGDWICNDDTGKATRKPLVTNPASGGGLACPAPEIQNCNDCKFTWSEWDCDSTSGKSKKSPNITKAASGGGKQCPEPEIQGCNDCQYTWGKWECDDATGVATRKAVVSKQQSLGGKPCPEPETQDCANCKFTWNETVCDTTTGKSLKSPIITTQGFGGGVVCPVPVEGACDRDCQFSWGGWQCDRTTGVSKRDPIITVSPLGSGQKCPTTDIGQCVKDCQYTWSDWQCDKTNGTKKRSPNITSVASSGGVECPGPETGVCDVDCVVNYPATWGVCDPATGKQSLTGTVTTARQNGGKVCDPLVKTQDCKVDCQVEWSNVWGPCNYLTESQGRNATVSVTAKNGGAGCGALTETQNCTRAGPYVYTTQVFAGQNPSNQFSQSGVPPGWGPVDFTSYGGLCVIDLNFTAWSPSINNIGVFALLIDGVAQLPLITFCFNAAALHSTIPSVFISLYLSPGVHKFSLSVNYSVTNTPVTVDTSDYMWLRVVEYSQQLVAGPNPSVYVTNVFNQARPVPAGDLFRGPGSPTGWTKTIVTYGGVVVVDLNFTAYTVENDQHTFFALIIDGQAQSPLIYWYNNLYTNNHKTLPASFTVYELAAGSHTFSIHTNYGTTSRALIDGNDTLNMRITEFSTSLTLNSLVSIIPIMVMYKSTGGFMLGSNTYFTKYFNTNGGTCIFNTSCSGWVNAQHNPSDDNLITFSFKFSNANSTTSVRNAKNGDGVLTTYYNAASREFIIENRFFMNVRTEHRVVNCNFIIDNLPAGEHYVMIFSIGNTFVDSGDTMNIRLIEFSKELTSGTPPALPAALTASTRPNYKGCYTDNVNSQRVFNQVVEHQTLAQCNTLAKTAGSPYFGIQNWPKSGGVRAMDTGECWFQKGSTLQSAQSQGSSSTCVIGTGGYNIGGGNTNAVYQTL